MQARRGELVDVLEGGAGAVAEIDGHGVGLMTWTISGGADSLPAQGRTAEVRAVAVAATVRGRGVGRALLSSADRALRDAGVRRAWLVTTNDNLTALALYQKSGWLLAELRANAIDELRRTIKPSIPEVGANGIPLRDELELTKAL
jgi:ribosomal protein S18 acetylase RimI-like enzyme